jgi:hypothetical protein
MRTLVAIIFTCLAACDRISAGPSLGLVGDVAITETSAKGVSCQMGIYQPFVFSTKNIKALLERAIIVTGGEVHDRYNIGPCYVSGTATFRGRPATWYLNEGGSGSIEIYGERLAFADPTVHASEE